ncbi:hypothetical protein ACFQE8_13630 [Salinirubellus sp. GCM10025818]|uniref:DUF7112 family protein n=1 Tax=Salinirubellus TaxID=2162630 RepID=UPI0030D37A9F
MPDRIAADNPSVETVRATLAAAGATGRPRIAVPDDSVEAFPVGEVVRLVLGGRTRFARIDRAIDDTVEIRGAYDNRRLAREADGENRLVEWADAEGVDVGRSVLVDVVEAGELYGVRRAGTSAVYELPETSRNDSLAAIAERTRDTEGAGDDE